MNSNINDVSVIILVLILIAAIETGIIAGLVSRAGSFRNLLRITKTYKRAHSTYDGKHTSERNSYGE